MIKDDRIAALLSGVVNPLGDEVARLTREVVLLAREVQERRKESAALWSLVDMCVLGNQHETSVAFGVCRRCGNTTDWLAKKAEQRSSE